MQNFRYLKQKLATPAFTQTAVHSLFSLLLSGRMRGSLATLERLVQIFPEDISLKNDLGVAHLLLGDNKGAKKVYEEVCVCWLLNVKCSSYVCSVTYEWALFFCSWLSPVPRFWQLPQATALPKFTMVSSWSQRTRLKRVYHFWR